MCRLWSPGHVSYATRLVTAETGQQQPARNATMMMASYSFTPIYYNGSIFFLTKQGLIRYMDLSILLQPLSILSMFFASLAKALEA